MSQHNKLGYKIYGMVPRTGATLYLTTSKLTAEEAKQMSSQIEAGYIAGCGVTINVFDERENRYAVINTNRFSAIYIEKEPDNGWPT